MNIHLIIKIKITLYLQTIHTLQIMFLKIMRYFKLE